MRWLKGIAKSAKNKILVGQVRSNVAEVKLQLDGKMKAVNSNINLGKRASNHEGKEETVEGRVWGRHAPGDHKKKGDHVNEKVKRMGKSLNLMSRVIRRSPFWSIRDVGLKKG